MIRALDGSTYTTLNDVNRMLTEQESVEVVYLRVYDGFRDDSKYHSHVKALMGQSSREGEVMLGTYQYLNHYQGSKEGDDQVVDAYATMNSGGRIPQLPHALDVEKTVSSPFPKDPRTYLDTRLMPAIAQVVKYDGREPVLYLNPDAILNYFVYLDGAGKKRSLFTLPQYAQVLKCPLWLAAYTKMGIVPYWDEILKLDIWKTLLMHQHAGSVRDWPGASNVDLNRGAGTRGQWKDWMQRKGPMPVWNTEPAPEPEPEPEPEPTSDLEKRVAKLELWAKSF